MLFVPNESQIIHLYIYCMHVSIICGNLIKDMPSLFIHTLIKLGLFNLCWVALLVANYFEIWLVNDETNDILVTLCS